MDNDVIDKKFAAYLGRGYSLYGVIARHANYKTQECFLSYETLMKETGIKTRNGISQYLKKLVNANMIRIKKLSRRKANHYFLIDKSSWKLPSSIVFNTTGAVSKNNSEQYQKLSRSSINMRTLNEQKKLTNRMNDFSYKEINEKRKALGENMRIKSL